ncbi:MAG: hypothetical protein K0U93_15105, partial [Gammaproteobacteria bacterium]|nr:hypothetical protein [Gammaproteobacteria bacterium]
MQYLRAHWRGEHSLARAFWVNFAVPCCVFGLLASALHPPLFEDPVLFAVISGGFFVLFRAVVFVWQVGGLLRTCDVYLKSFGHVVWVWAVYGAIVLALVLAVAATFTMLQTGLGLYRVAQRPPPAPVVAPYHFAPAHGGTWLHVSGDIAPGITRDLEAYLAAHRSELRGVVLRSEGGSIFEARGLAKVIQQLDLDTAVDVSCRSACTLAYVAGKHRYLPPGATLGFHQYRLNARAQMPFLDIQGEQQRDRDFFASRGVAPKFLDRVYRTSPDDIWL